ADGAEPVRAVPVERGGAQGAFQVCGDGEQIRYAGLARGPSGAGRTTGAFQGAHGRLGAEGGHQPALVAGEFGEAVQSVGETVRLRCGTACPRQRPRGSARVRAATAATVVLVGVPDGVRVERAVVRGAQDGGQFAVVLHEAPACTATVHHPVVLGRPQRCRPYPRDLRRQRGPARVLLGLTAAERVDVELVLAESAHQAVAPEPGVTAQIRKATFRKQSDAHECTPDLPYEEPPLTRRLAAGRTYADQAVVRWTVVRRTIRRGERS